MSHRVSSLPQHRFRPLPVIVIVLLIAGLTVAAVLADRPAGPAPLTPPVQLVVYQSGLNLPVKIANSGAPGDGRLFIVEQGGFIRIVNSGGGLRPDPFLDLSDRIVCCGEQGLLGLAFHPDYLNNGYFYVNYTRADGDTVISRFSVSGDPNIANPDSEFILMGLSQPYDNHNGGDLAFGPDGYLYIPTGDGGFFGDPQENAQNLSAPLGKILRINVDEGDPYAIPPDNPFIGIPGALPEIWAYGLRNPWRFSFDRLTGDMFVGDVGQGSWEEIDFQPAGSAGGQFYGWVCYEGNHPYELTGCSFTPTDYVFPIHEYSHSVGHAVTGGYVYRGSAYPTLAGSYFFADFSDAKLWSLFYNGSGWELTAHGTFSGRNFSTFGEDVNGELYIADYNGVILRIQAADAPTPTSPPPPTPTITPFPMPTETSTPIPPSPSPTVTPENTPSPSPTATETATATAMPTATPTVSPTPPLTPPATPFKTYLPVGRRP